MIQQNWIMETVVDVAAMHGRTELPKIVWRNGSSKLSSGHFKRAFAKGGIRKSRKYGLLMYTKSRKPSIVVTAGTSGSDHLPVLLHELAHWLTPRDGGHGKSFWKKAFELYEKFKVGQEHYEREFKYMKTASKVYQAMQAK